ncbi:MAG: hypothetical protein KAG43_09600, partial [Candidatus Marithrix sp.]|nr:hypothetical protein [Candidatus Marithrix sp.]
MLKDEHWLDILANKDIDVSENDPDEVRETKILREAILAEERLQQLTSRLQTDGYIKPDTSIWEKFFNWQTTYLVV